MRVLSGVTDQYIYFVGVDSTDFATRETGLSSFTVYRSRNGGASSVMTTPTINETDSTNLAGVYELLLDEDMTIGSGNDSEEMVFHITHAGMSPVTRTIELYRPKITVGNTLDVTATGAAGIDWGNIENKTTANDLSGTDIQLVDTVTTYTGNTKQTVDNNVLAAGATGFSAIDTVVDAIKAITDQFAFTVANVVDSNALAISGDTAAADNLELQYDGTGIAGDTYPATQAQLSGLANVGSAVHKASSSYTLTTGTQSANLYTDTAALDAVRHTHTDAAGVIEFYYEFSVGSGIPSSVQVTGYLTGSNDDVDIYGYDWNASGWVQIGTISGSSSSSNSVYSFDMFVDMVGSGANKGTVRVRFYKASGLTSATFALDQIFIAYNQGASGYVNGAIWYDDAAANTGTVAGVDGVAGNEVSTEAAVNTLFTNTKLHKVNVAPGSTYSLANTHNNRIVLGHGATLALGGQDCDETHFLNMAVSGIGTAVTEMEFHDCEFSTASVQKTHFYDCTFDETVTFTLAGDYHITNSQSGVAGSGSPTFTKTAGQAITAEFRRWSGGVTFSGIESGDILTIGGELGTVTLNGASGSVEIRGTYKSVVDNRTTSPSLNVSGAIKGGSGAYDGVIHVDTINGSAGTVDYLNGTTTNPSSLFADAQTIAASVNLYDYKMAPGSSLTLASDTSESVLEGHEWTIALGNQNIANSMFIDATVSGTATGNDAEFEQCLIGISSLAVSNFHACAFTATTSGGCTLSAAGDYRFDNCSSGVAGTSSPLFTFATAAITAEFRRWSGGIAFAGLTSDDTITISGELGTIDLGSPASAVTVEVRGTYKAITNIGSASVNIDGAIKGADVASTLALTSKIPLSDGVISWNATAIAAIKAEVDTALATTTYAEPGAIPAATASLEDKISFLYTLARNKITQTATTSTLRNDADSGNIGTSTVSDDATTATRGEWG